VKFENVFVPYRSYWSTPFCRWQGSLAGEHPLKLAAVCAAKSLAKSGCAAARLQGIHFGMTVPQAQSFYGAPWLAALIGANHITGPTISQACATSARVLASAAAAVETKSSNLVMAAAADRISNGPHIYYPDPSAPGGLGESENWVWDNFNQDPHAKVAMVQTAENVAAKFDISRAEQDALTLRRYEQYQMARADDCAFQSGYIQKVDLKYRHGPTTLSEDEGIVETTREGIEKLKPVIEGGSVTYATQTHPADGNAGMLLAGPDEAKDLSDESNVQIQLLAFGEGRAEKAHMGMAPVPAAQAALAAAELTMDDIAVVKPTTRSPSTTSIFHAK